MKTRDDLPHFLNRLGLTGVGVEVGVHQGSFSQTYTNRCFIKSFSTTTEIPVIYIQPHQIQSGKLFGHMMSLYVLLN